MTNSPPNFAATNTPDAGADDLVDTRGAARHISERLLRVSPRTLESWRKDGIGPNFVRLSAAPGRRGRVRYSKLDLDFWIESRIVAVGTGGK